jgi:hypothetical protein
MLKSIFWGSVLYGDNSEHIHRGHITCTPPVPQNPYEIFWFLGIIFAVVFVVIGIPLIKVLWDIKKHPNKPVRRVAKK